MFQNEYGAQYKAMSSMQKISSEQHILPTTSQSIDKFKPDYLTTTKFDHKQS